MTTATRRRAAPTPGELEDVRQRKRARDALKKIGEVDKLLDNLSGGQLAYLASALEWFADLPRSE